MLKKIKNILFLIFSIYITLFLSNIFFTRYDDAYLFSSIIVIFIFSFFLFWKSYLTKINKYLIFFSIIFVLHIQTCFINRIQVKGKSMEPNLKDKSFVWIEKVSTGIQLPQLFFSAGNFPLGYKLFPLGFQDWKRGELVAFYYPNLGGHKAIFFIKRIIALAGDEYSFKERKIWINQKELKENYLAKGTLTKLEVDFPPLTVSKIPRHLEDLDPLFSYSAQFSLPAQAKIPSKCVLVLGDNRENSQDSRSFGFSL